MNYLETDQGQKLLKQFLKKYEGKGTQKVYRSEINQFFKWYGGTLEALTRAVFEKYGKHLAETTGAQTVKRKFSILNRFFKFITSQVKGFTSPIGKKHGDMQSFQSACYAESGTFKRNLEQWKDILIQPSTKETYTINVRLFFNWAGKTPGDLTQADFNQYRKYLSDKGQKPSTIWNKFISVNRFLIFLAEKNRNFKNPLEFAKLKLARPQKDAGYHNVLTYSEVKALMKAPDKRTLIGKRDHAILMLMTVYGPRAGEVCNLRWKDIEPERVNGQQKIWIRDRKGRAGNRKTTAFILNGKLLQAWDDWLENNDIHYDDNTPVFIGFRWDRKTRSLEINQHQIRKQKPLTVTTIENIVNKYIEQAGISPGSRVLSPHALRHTAFTEMSGSGEPIAVIKYIAGHEDANTTMLYTYHNQGYDDNIAFKSRFNK
ncbi:Putative tyrosine recombinase, XerC-like [Desulfonema limicola]|uniref:Tyrosine recombinase, XerC-like n=1 Tax=Desulfonema limicola TaxID=45656 RepID=A0A975BEI7_9BACT|nr:site-specific integrase [Desulfonema limicola]QTA83901.1 Putative tyrosine recombinase, XerC-like [Desulfonema limicola]